MAMLKTVSALLVLATVCGTTNAGAESCTFTDPKGKKFDFSPLINPSGHYTFIQEVWNIGGFSLDSMSADSQVNVSFYIQVCGNIQHPPTGCNDVGFAYSVMPDGTCTSWGNANVSIFDVNPYGDGANWKVFHGTALNHYAYMEGHIYFVCKQGLPVEQPTFEHIKAAVNQAHFKFFTKHAC